MVLPLIAVYGLYTAGGAVFGALTTWGVSKLLEDDATKLKKMDVEYEKKRLEVEYQKKIASTQAEKLKAEIEVLNLEKLKMTITLEIKEMKAKAAEADVRERKPMLELVKLNKA